MVRFTTHLLIFATKHLRGYMVKESPQKVIGQGPSLQRPLKIQEHKNQRINQSKQGSNSRLNRERLQANPKLLIMSHLEPTRLKSKERRQR